MVTTAMIHVRVDEQIKNQSEDTLAMMGLTISDAVQIFLIRVVMDKKMPFLIKAANAETRSAMAESDEIAKAHNARFTSPDSKFEGLQKRSYQLTGLCALK